MKEIAYRGGLVVFDIPAAWREEYDESGEGAFYLDSPDSGTLRLSVLTFQKIESDSPLSSASVLTNQRGAGVRTLVNSNSIRSYVKRTEEDGEPITIYWWELANVVPPSHARIALFSYTVLSSQEGSVELAGEIKLLQRSIEAARFCTELGL